MKKRRCSTSVALLLLVLFDTAYSDCNICGFGNVITKPEGQIANPSNPNQLITCAAIQANDNLIPPDLCTFFPAFVINNCGCTPDTPAPTIVPPPVPTSAPTRLPSPAPTFAPSSSPTNPPSPNPTQSPTALPCPDIVSILGVSENLSLLVSALEATNLATTLSRPFGPYTVFAPKNSAFEALSNTTLDFLFDADNTDLLTDLLLYHVVDGMVLSIDLVDGMMVETLQGESISVTSPDGLAVFVDDSLLVRTDIVVANGIIHVVDEVLLSPSFVGLMQNKTTLGFR